MAFTDAMRADALTEPGNNQGGGVKQLENQAMAHRRELANHVDHEVPTQRERQRFGRPAGAGA